MKPSNQNKDDKVKTPTNNDLPDWLSKYPEGWREFLHYAGEDDRGIKAIEAYNYEIIDVAKGCEGQPRVVLKTVLGFLYEDWHDVLSRHVPKSASRTSMIAQSADTASPEPEDADRMADLSTEEGRRQAYRSLGAARYLALRTGIEFSKTSPQRLGTYGHGPVQHHASGGGGFKALDRWISHVFDLDEPQAEQFARNPMFDSPDEAKPWLYVVEHSPDSDYVRNHVVGWGGRVLGPVELALEAAQIAGREHLAGAILEMDWNIEAAFLITDILFQRRIPFVIITRETKLSPTIATGGVVLRNPSMDEIRFALESLPARATIGMDFARELNIEWG